MTVPTLISKYQKHAYVVGLKKAYASLCNAMKMLPLNEGCSSGDFDCLGWNSETEGEDFNEMRTKLISQQFKINKFCGRDNINDCIKFYLPEEKAPSVGGAFVTDDGMIFHSTYGALVDTAMIMMVDVNGDKGPNVAGRDIFAFEIVGKEFDGVPAGTVMPTGSELRTRYGKAGGSVSSTTGWRNTDGCPNNLPTSYTKALNCTGRVLEEDAMNY